MSTSFEFGADTWPFPRREDDNGQSPALSGSQPPSTLHPSSADEPEEEDDTDEEEGTVEMEPTEMEVVDDDDDDEDTAEGTDEEDRMTAVIRPVSKTTKSRNVKHSIQKATPKRSAKKVTKKKRVKKTVKKTVKKAPKKRPTGGKKRTLTKNTKRFSRTPSKRKGRVVHAKTRKGRAATRTKKTIVRRGKKSAMPKKTARKQKTTKRRSTKKR